MYQLSFFPLHDSAFTGHRLINCGHQECQGPYETRQHLHPCYSLHLVLSGSGFFRTRNREWKLEAGDGFLIFPHELVSYQASAAAPWTYEFISFSGTDAASLAALSHLSPEKPVFFKAGIELKGCIRNFIQSTQINSSPLALHILLLQCFSILAKPAPAGASEHLKTALHYLQQNYAYPLEISTIARQTGIDRTYLFRLFKQETGLSPQIYLRNFRLEKARALLLETSLTLDEIAASTGLGSAAQLSKAFRQQYGCSPGSLRKSK